MVNSPWAAKNVIGPALMIVSTNTQAGSLFVFSKDRPQASAHKAIQALKSHRMSVFKVVKPTAKRRIQIPRLFSPNCLRACAWSSSECDLEMT